MGADRLHHLGMDVLVVVEGCAGQDWWPGQGIAACSRQVFSRPMTVSPLRPRGLRIQDGLRLGAPSNCEGRPARLRQVELKRVCHPASLAYVLDWTSAQIPGSASLSTCKSKRCSHPKLARCPSMSPLSGISCQNAALASLGPWYQH